jgi:hypothetical protein
LITVDRAGADDGTFLEHVQRLANGLCRTSAPTALHLIGITSWFDVKWLRYSGKGLVFVNHVADMDGVPIFGTHPLWQSQLTVPPFHPHRVRSQHLYRRLVIDTFISYVLMPVVRPLHVWQPSTDNVSRRLTDIAPGATCLWYSGDSAMVGRGAIMAYVPGAHDYWTWYVEYRLRGSAWTVGLARGVSPAELQHIESASEG